MIAEKSVGHSSSVISPPPPVFFGCSPPDARRQRMAVAVLWRPWCGVQKLGGSRTPAANPPQMPRRQRMAVAVVQKFKVQRLGVQRLGVLGHRVQRQGSSSEFWGIESRGRAADQQAEKLLTSLKTEKAPVWVSVGCRKRWPRPLRSVHRGAEKAGTGIRGSPRTGRGRKNSPPLRRLMITRSRGGGGGRDGSGLSAPSKCPSVGVWCGDGGRV